ncbi:hypothetical protein [Paenibacillus hamazuiensis]|uniref:hypothetical protein n=1 Tax=Paenibacillus hamazuiensis TaxID=2936508 RepID=UPI00200BD00A|nr:hypothetical protein [Paenibacillus hamazuiensis]
MRMNFAKFNGALPYASELYGVYQPLIGWKSRLTSDRGNVALQMPAFPHEIDLVPPQRDTREWGMLFDHFVPQIERAIGRDPFEKNPDAVQFAPAAEIDSLVLRSIQTYLIKEILQYPDEKESFWSAHFQNKFTTETLRSLFQEAAGYFLKWMRELRYEPQPKPEPMHEYLSRAMTLFNGEQSQNMETFFEYILNKEIFVTRYLDELSRNNPKRLAALFLNAVKIQSTAEVIRSLDPAYLSPLAGREAVFSPIGILHLYRQYFFEFDTFLGPPVEHIWLSPGATTELYEIATRRTLVEKSFEQFSETVLRTDTQTTDEEEISQALKKENLNDTKMGSSVEGGVNILIVSIEAGGDISNQQTQKIAREENHRRMRQQSAKLSSEIRNNFKSVFKTVTEVTDTRSKRYVISNDTGKLANYELRRKMRQVGVQVQDAGTQLCWQVYVDDPGAALGVAELVHLASKADLSPYTALPIQPEPKGLLQVMNIDLVVPNPGQRSNVTATIAAGAAGFAVASVPGAIVAVGVKEVIDDLFGDDEPEDKSYGVNTVNKIIQQYKIGLPNGYQLASAVEQLKGLDDEFVRNADGSATGDIPIRWLGRNGQNLNWRAKLLNPAEGTIELVIDRGKVTPGEVIEFQARIALEPTADYINSIKNANAANVEKNKQLDIEKANVMKKEFIQNVQERVKMAADIRSRKTEDLREEERTVIFRSLIAKLMREAWSVSATRELAHIRSELLKSIFEIDRMLYFVAPEWWQPRLHRSTQDLGHSVPVKRMNATSIAALNKHVKLSAVLQKAKSFASRGRTLGTLEEDDTVSWGGEGRPDNYLITQDSEPARLGSSLGWLLQLDGDNLRNAFLNAPWVKAVIPIRPGKEREALEWLMLSQVEGTAGLDAPYAGSETELQGLTNKEALFKLVDEVHAKWEKSRKLVSEQVSEPAGDTGAAGQERSIAYLPAERIFERGFDPLAAGFRADPLNEFEVVDFWTEILPTDQVVAVEVKYDPATGLQVPVED